MSREIQTAAATMAAVLAMAAPASALAAEAMRVVRDAQTGELRGPTAAEAAAFDRAAAQLRASRGQPAAAAPVEIRHPDGSVETKLGDDTHLYSVVSSDAKGVLSFDCLPAAQARQYVRSGGKPAFAAAPRPRAVKATAKANVEGGKAHE